MKSRENRNTVITVIAALAIAFALAGILIGLLRNGFFIPHANADKPAYEYPAQAVQEAPIEKSVTESTSVAETDAAEPEPEPVKASVWDTLPDGSICYYQADGTLAEGLTVIGEKTYYFVNNAMETGEIQMPDGTLKAFGEDGAEIIDGWFQDHYFGADGVMMTSAYVDGQFVDMNGNVMTNGVGDAGRLVIPSVGVDVEVYNASIDFGVSQAICDAENSAVEFYTGFPHEYITDTLEPIVTVDTPYIGDHKGQGFEAIKSCVPGTEAFIVNTDGTVSRYVCSVVDPNGANTGEEVMDSAGLPLRSDTSCSISLYTCNQDWHHVTVVKFVAG